MPILFYVLMFLLLFILFLIVGYYALTLFNETELLGARLRRVSQMLQKAELDTDVPYFTSLGKYLDVENPTMFLIAKRRTVFQPIEEEQEDAEQSPLDKTSESDQQEQTSDEGGEVSDSSHISEGSQVVPPPAEELDQYTPVFTINKEE